MSKNKSTLTTKNSTDQIPIDVLLTKLRKYLSLYSTLNGKSSNLNNIIREILNILNQNINHTQQTEQQTNLQTEQQTNYDEWKTIMINIIKDINKTRNIDTIDTINQSIYPMLDELLRLLNPNPNPNDLVINLEKLYFYIMNLTISVNDTADLRTTILNNIIGLINNTIKSNYTVLNIQSIAKPNSNSQAFEKINEIIKEINNATNGEEFKVNFTNITTNINSLENMLSPNIQKPTQKGGSNNIVQVGRAKQTSKYKSNCGLKCGSKCVLNSKYKRGSKKQTSKRGSKKVSKKLVLKKRTSKRGSKKRTGSKRGSKKQTSKYGSKKRTLKK